MNRQNQKKKSDTNPQENVDKSFTHLILTRFNLNYSYLNKNFEYICDADWHDQRFDLFFTYCVPSVQSQTCKNFKWLIFFNKELKNDYQNEIERAIRKVPQIEFIFVAPDENHLNLLKDYVRTRVTSEYLITSRLDNDDYINLKYIEELQKVYHANERVDVPYLINAGSGYQAEIHWPYRIGLVKGRSYSSFITLISSNREESGPATVLDYQHQEWANRTACIELIDQPAWIQIIHEKNLANHIKTMRLYTGIISKDFKSFHDKFGILARLIIYPVQFFISLKKKLW